MSNVSLNDIKYNEIDSKTIKHISSLHQKSFADYELSVKLGDEFLDMFYTLVNNRSDSFTYYATSGNDILGFVTGFTNYVVFNKKLHEEAGIHRFIWAGSGIMQGSISLAEIIDSMRYKKVLRNLTSENCHLGALAISPKIKGSRKSAVVLKKLLSMTLMRIKNANTSDTCFGVCDSRNKVMLNILINKMGFTVKDEIQGFSKKLIVTEVNLSDKKLSEFIIGDELNFTKR